MKKRIKLSFCVLLVLLILNSCGIDEGISPSKDQLSNKAILYTAQLKGLYEKNVALDENNFILLSVDVTELGNYSYTTTEQNGYKFTASGEFTKLGDTVVKLQAVGTPTEKQVDKVAIMIGEEVKDVSVNVLSNLTNKVIVASGENKNTKVWKTIVLTGRGELLWEKPMFSNYAAIENDVLYLNSREALIAVDLITGNEIWSNNSLADLASITLANNILYCATDYSDYYAVNASTGEEIWMYDAGVGYYPEEAPVVGTDLVYVSAGSDLHALNKTDGTLSWKKTNVSIEGTPVLNNDYLYISGGYDKFTVLNATDGTEKWSKAIASRSSPVFSNGRLYVNGGGKVNCIDPTTGELLWNKAVTDLALSPVVHDNKVLVTTDFGFTGVYCLDATTGEELWKKEAMGFPETELVAHEGLLYLGTGISLNGYNIESGDLVTVFGGFLQPNNPFAMDYAAVMAAYNTTSKEVAYPSKSGMN